MKEGWKYKKLGEVCDIYNGNSINAEYKKDNYFGAKLGLPFIATKDIICNGSIDYDNGVRIPDYHNYKVAPANSVFICAEGGCAGKKFAYVEKNVCFGNKLFCIKPKDNNLEGKFIYHYIQSDLFKKQFTTFISGLIGGVSSKKFQSIEIFMPSLNEQKKIVSRLDAAFAHIDVLKANAEKQLKDARALFQKSLAKAMEPKEGWEEKKLRDIVSFFSGYAFESKGYSNKKDDILLVCGDNIIHCDFRWDTIKRWPKDQFEDLKRFALEKNDIVLAMDRPWVKSGLKIAKITPNELPSLLIQRTACIRAEKRITSDFLFYALLVDKFINHLVSQQTGVGVPHISGKQILSYDIPFPTITEQQRIVERLDSLSAHVRELEEIQKKIISESDALKQALLRKVFELLVSDKKMS